MLDAVIVNDPATAEENVTEVVVWLVKDPPVFAQVTPAPPTSLVTVAVNLWVCDVVNPPRVGLMDTVIGAATQASLLVESALATKNKIHTTRLLPMCMAQREPHSD